jgi:1-acyl-sn-glycerol-3-phosphate acyltransferase
MIRPMLRFLPSFLRGAIALVLLVVNTLFWCLLLFACALVKLAFPFPAVRRRIDPVLNAIATCWIACNSGWMRLTQAMDWDVQGVDRLPFEGWYLVNCNHQSWADIFVLQHLLNRRIPMLKFFLKQQLIYVPVIGLAWWALDFPFMKRHGKAQLRANPAAREEDREATRRACEKFALVPTSVMNFAEGTRFTPDKHRMQASPYDHLLKPKAGALALALNAMGERFHSLIDVTIVYPAGVPSFWQFLCGRAPRVVVRMRQLPIPAEFCTADYTADPAFRAQFGQWLANLWQEKDAQIRSLLHGAAAVLLLACALGGGRDAMAQEALGVAAMHARYTALGPQLRSNQFQGPVYLDSAEGARVTRGDVYAVVNYPFATVSAALDDPSHWCDVLILHLNTKYCRGAVEGAATHIEVRVGRKYDQPAGDASLLSFSWRAVSLTPEYMDIELDSPSGPFGTRDYRILLEAVPLDAAHSFIHLAYAFGYGVLGHVAMHGYLTTVASDKVGFTVAKPPEGGQPAEYVGSTRGLVERNTMRYYLAIDAYLAALSLPPAERAERRLQTWFAATERFPRQLHEMDRASYLEMKRKEIQRMQVAQ